MNENSFNQNTTHPTGSVRYPEIDYLRALAVVLILIRHFHYAMPFFITDYPIYLQGTWSGVDLFFVISGFVITLSLQKTYTLLQQNKISIVQYLGSFFVKRIFRLMPLALLVLSLNLWLAYAFNQSGQFGPFSAIQNEMLPILFYYYNYYIWYGGSTYMSWFWSLSIEEQFYFVYPFLLLALPKTWTRYVFFIAGIVLVTFILRPFTTPNFKDVQNNLWPVFTAATHLRFDDLLAGCLIACIHMQYTTSISAWVRNNAALTKFLAVACLFGIACFGSLLPHYELTGYPTILLCASVLVFLGAARLSIIPAFGIRKILIWIGQKSYAIYLFHLIAIRIVNECWFRYFGLAESELSNSQGILGFFIAMLLTFALASISYKWIESTCIRWSHSLSARILGLTKEKFAEI